MKNRIIIHVDGGIVQGVYSDQALPDDLQFFICDTDTDGATPETDDKVLLMGDGEPAFFAEIAPEVLSDRGRKELTPKEREG